MSAQPPSVLRAAWPLIRTALHAALFIVSTVVVFIEEARSPALVTAFHGLWIVMLGLWTWDSWRDWRKGLLSMTFSQLRQQIAEGRVRRTSLLELLSILMGIAAMSTLSLN